MTLGSRKLRGIEATSIWSEMPGKAAGAVFPVLSHEHVTARPSERFRPAHR